MTRSIRLLAVSAAAVALASLLLAALAPAAVRDGRFVAGKGQIELGYDFSFNVRKGRITHLRAHVLEQCFGSSESNLSTIAPTSSWKIRADGRFSGRHKEVTGKLTSYITLAGRFSRGVAKGTVRQASVLNGGKCDTSKLKFSAKRR